LGNIYYLIFQVKRFEEALLSSGIQLEEIDEEPYRDYEIGTDYDTASPS